MTSQVDIMQIPLTMLPDMAPHIGEHLARGMKGSGRHPFGLAVDVARDHAQVWAIFTDGKVVGAFMTAVIIEDDQRKAVDVFGLAGQGIMKWGKRLADRMVDFAKANGADRVVFAGRRGLMKAYGGLNVIGTRGDQLVFERTVQ